jgi:NDP-sugar pyrophosphorylase family protein
MVIDTAVVLAAGEGNRLRPLTSNRPKPMLPAANRPILEHVLDTLVEAGVERIVLVVGYKHDRVQEYFGPTYRDVELTYVYQAKQLGSGHALLQARSAVDGPFIAVNGDRVLEPRMVADVVETFERTGDPTLAVLEHPDTSQYGAVVLEGDRVIELVEKPDHDRYRLINAGVYAFSEDLFDLLEATPRQAGELPLPDVLAASIEDGTPVRGVLTDGLWVDATYPWDLLYLARQLLLDERVAEPERASDIHVAKSALVHDRATLVAPVVVGADAEIGAGAVVGPDTAIGRNVTVGANATVQRSVLDADTRVGPNSTLLDCVTGQDVDLGAGTLVPGGLADVRVGRKVFENQRLGAVFADRAVAAGGVTCAPGTLVGPSARLRTGATVDGRIEEGEVVR